MNREPRVRYSTIMYSVLYVTMYVLLYNTTPTHIYKTQLFWMMPSRIYKYI
jgi:hypothetical protein